MLRYSVRHLQQYAPRYPQRGVVLVVGMLAALALLGVAGLALDISHILLNKTRLQNLADLAALNAAKIYDDSGNIEQAEASVPALLSQSAALDGNSTIAARLADGSITVAVEHSTSLNPFAPGTTPVNFIRVGLSGFSVPTVFAQVLGFNTLAADVAAVAGPSPALDQNICDLAPMLACGEADVEGDELLFGYALHEPIILKQGSGQTSEVGPGNFQLLSMDGNTGAADLRQALAGGYEAASCASSGGTVETEPGNTVGPVVQGLNTRFGLYSGPLQDSASLYPADPVTDAPTPPLALDDAGTIVDSYDASNPGHSAFYYSDYTAAYAAGTASGAIDCSTNSSPCQRRILTIPVGQCTGASSGKSDVTVYGFLCVYLIQPVVQKGNEAHVFAQVVEGCNTEGRFGSNPGPGPAPTKIILYKDPDRDDA